MNIFQSTDAACYSGRACMVISAHKATSHTGLPCRRYYCRTGGYGVD